MPETNTFCLYEAKKKNEFIVAKTPDIALLKNLGIRAGTRIKIQHRYALGGPVLLWVEGTYTVAVGKDIAKQIEVRP
jgi:hypothetical protein